MELWKCPKCKITLESPDFYDLYNPHPDSKCPAGCGYPLGSFIFGNYEPNPLAKPQEEGFVPAAVKDDPAIEVKKGDDIIWARLRRDALGLKLFVKAHPAVEQFVKSLGNGSVKQLELFGGKHQFSLEGKPPIQIYNLATDVSNVSGIRLDLPGGPIEDPDGRVNISFLRAQGISQGDGVAIAIRGVFSYDKMKQLENRIGESCRRLYREFINTTDLVVVLSTKDL